MSVTIPDGKTAATMETLAREKAWSDLLGHVRLSLEIWQIDPDVRAHCEHVVMSLRRLAAELTTLSDHSTRPGSTGGES